MRLLRCIEIECKEELLLLIGKDRMMEIVNASDIKYPLLATGDEDDIYSIDINGETLLLEIAPMECSYCKEIFLMRDVIDHSDPTNNICPSEWEE